MGGLKNGTIVRTTDAKHVTSMPSQHKRWEIYSLEDNRGKTMRIEAKLSVKSTEGMMIRHSQPLQKTRHGLHLLYTDILFKS
jgi:hypothetical protein